VLAWIATSLRPAIEACGAAEMDALLRGLDGRFVRPGPSGAPTRGRPDVLPTGRNFFAVDVRAVPTPSAWRIGRLAAERLVEAYWQEAGEWPRTIALSAWGTSNMRTGGDDVAQVLALIGARPLWEESSGRVTGFAIIPLSELKRPRVDVTLRVSGLFRDAFPTQMDIVAGAISAIALLDEPDDANPIAANVRAGRQALEARGMDPERAQRQAGYRVFGSKPGAYGAGLQALIDEGGWEERADLAGVYLDWGGYAYGRGVEGELARDAFAGRLADIDLVAQTQDNREHDILDSDDYYQFIGGLAATVQTMRGEVPRIAHIDTSRPEAPLSRSLSQEISRVVRGRAANPKWIAGVMRHGYKGAFEIAATVDYLFGFAASTNAVSNHPFRSVVRRLSAGRAGANIHGGGQSGGAKRDRRALRRGDPARAVDAALQPCRRSDRGIARDNAEGNRMTQIPAGTDEAENIRHREKARKHKAARDKIMASKTGEKGLLIVHTGTGKGKTSAALGMVFRHIGHGYPVGVVQFTKSPSWDTGEARVLAKFPDLVTLHIMGEGFTWETQDRERDIAAATKGWERAKQLIRDDRHRMVLLDELNIVLRYDYLPIDAVLSFLRDEKPADKHVVVTGRNAHASLIEMADLVTEMTLIKHPFRAGVKGQKGIEF
jgi:cobaltochelatase CobN